MKKLGKYLFVFAIVVIGFTSCTQSDVVEELNVEANLKSGHLDHWTHMTDFDWYYSMNQTNIDICGEKDVYPFFDAAMVSIMNDENYIYIHVKVEDGWKLRLISLNLFNEGDELSRDYENFPYQMEFTRDSDTKLTTFKIPKGEWSDCIKLNVKIRAYNEALKKWASWWLTSDNETGYNYYLDYCWKECNPCPPQKIGDIVAAQHHNVGDLVVWEDDEYLYINYDLEEGFNLDEAHVYVGCIDKMPATKNGNPKNGNFPYHIDDFNGNVLMIPLADLEDVCKDANGCWPIAAHGVVSKTMGNKTWSETSWSTGTKFDAKRWGWYSTYCPCE
ncbi:hypothetical protein [Labilibacter marinus]|uniref:hypothetical protein n=1 Tax=Labilibacter marinus TaxID=1477105 RepID=UPI0008311979|nr:hypothetical protein [Labilibacter marinus]